MPLTPGFAVKVALHISVSITEVVVRWPSVLIKFSSSETVHRQIQKGVDTRKDDGPACCWARIIFSVDHLTIHIPAKPINTMTVPKVRLMIRSGDNLTIVYQARWKYSVAKLSSSPKKKL